MADYRMPHTLPTETLAAWLRLSLTPGLGPVQGQRLLQHFSTPLAIAQCSPARLSAIVPKALAEGLLYARSPAVSQHIDHALRWADHADHFLLTPDQTDYPALLQQSVDAPLVLYAKGTLSPLKSPALAIVGARNATPDGLDHAHTFACELAAQGWCIVSGLAQGIDAAAHRGALQAGPTGGGTLAILGTGADEVYPNHHKGLVKQLLEAGGLLLTEFELGTPARPHHFPRRNRIVAGLSRGVLVVEAALKSGSLITAKLAVNLDREVFAIPGSIHSPLSKGPHALILEGAKLVEGPQDIIQELRAYHPAQQSLRIPPSVSAADVPKTPASLPPCSPVLDAIGYDPVTEDILQQRTNMLPAILQCELLMLELNGAIERRPNGRIVRSRRRH